MLKKFFILAFIIVFLALFAISSMTPETVYKDSLKGFNSKYLDLRDLEVSSCRGANLEARPRGLHVEEGHGKLTDLGWRSIKDGAYYDITEYCIISEDSKSFVVCLESEGKILKIDKKYYKKLANIE